jgi:hypothetical protein
MHRGDHDLCRAFQNHGHLPESMSMQCVLRGGSLIDPVPRHVGALNLRIMKFMQPSLANLAEKKHQCSPLTRITFVLDDRFEEDVV